MKTANRLERIMANLTTPFELLHPYSWVPVIVGDESPKEVVSCITSSKIQAYERLCDLLDKDSHRELLLSRYMDTPCGRNIAAVALMQGSSSIKSAYEHLKEYRRASKQTPIEWKKALQLDDDHPDD